MVNRKEKKLEWAFREKEKGEKNKDLAYLCGIGIRQFQKLYAEYKITEKMPNLNWSFRRFYGYEVSIQCIIANANNNRKF